MQMTGGGAHLPHAAAVATAAGAAGAAPRPAEVAAAPHPAAAGRRRPEEGSPIAVAHLAATAAPHRRCCQVRRAMWGSAALDGDMNQLWYVALRGAHLLLPAAAHRCCRADEPPEVGSIHHGRVVSVRPFGVFVELPGRRKQALIHSSQVRSLRLWFAAFLMLCACCTVQTCKHTVCCTHSCDCYMFSARCLRIAQSFDSNPWGCAV